MRNLAQTEKSKQPLFFKKYSDGLESPSLPTVYSRIVDLSSFCC